MFVSFSTYALQITLSETQLSEILAATFPLSRSYEGVNVSFSKPSIKLNDVDNSISIKTFIVAQHKAQLLRANGTIKGIIEYNPQDKTLHIVKPTLSEFNLIDNQIAEAEQAIDTVKQSVGKNLPMILLIDFSQFDLGFTQAMPKKIDIVDQGITLYF